MIKFKTEFNLDEIKHRVAFLIIAKKFDFRVSYLGGDKAFTHKINCRRIDFDSILELTEEYQQSEARR